MSKLILILITIVFTALSLVIGAMIQNRLPWSQPPGYLERLKMYLTNNHVETRDDHPWSELRTREFNGTVELIHVLTEQAVTQLGWDILLSNQKNKSIHAVATSKLWKYKDDIHITFITVDTQHTQVKISSSSRKGRGDLGTNSRHVMNLYHQIEQNLANNVIAPR